MRTVYLDKGIQPMRPSVATIGFFDGVHRGHRFLIRQLMEDAERKGLESTVITFDRHPRQVLQADYQPQLLTTFDEKQVMLSKTGVDNMAVLSFDAQMARLSAREFMERVLSGLLNVKKLYIGYDHRFGHNREEGFEDYVRYGRELGIEVVQSEAYELNGVSVSSSVIRSFLQEGEVEMAERCLGYPYILLGKVSPGVQEGRKLGFPTANLVVDSCKLIPAAGAYAVSARLENSTTTRPAMMNIGTRPTFGENAQTLEVHILDYNGNLYGERLAVGFVRRLREEHKFRSPEELARQLQQDAEKVREVMSGK